MINYWVGIINPIHSDILDYIEDSEAYTGGTDTTLIIKLLGMLHDPNSVLGMFKSYTGRYLYSLYVTDQEDYGIMLAENLSFKELGAWDMEGNAVADQHPTLLNHTPDNWIQDTESSGHWETATVIADVNLLAGQSPRSFS